MQMLYTGQMQVTSGRVGKIASLSRANLIAGQSDSPPSPDELLAMCPETGRTPLDESEVKYRPSLNGRSFRGDGVGTDSGDNQADYCLVLGRNGTSATYLPHGDSSGVAIGFAFTGMPTGQSLSFTFTKVVEWRPKLSFNLVALPPRTGGITEAQANGVVAILDKHLPGWQTTARHALETAGAAVAKYVFSQVQQAGPMLLTL
jgi:hypothetical protein